MLRMLSPGALADLEVEEAVLRLEGLLPISVGQDLLGLVRAHSEALRRVQELAERAEKLQAAAQVQQWQAGFEQQLAAGGHLDLGE